MDASAGEDQLADHQGRPFLPGDLDRGTGIAGGLAGEDLVQDRVETRLRDRPAADGGEELRHLADRDGLENGLLTAESLVQFADRTIGRERLMRQEQDVADPARRVQLPQRLRKAVIFRLICDRVTEPGHGTLEMPGEVGHPLLPGGEVEQLGGILALAQRAQGMEDLPGGRELAEHLPPARRCFPSCVSAMTMLVDHDASMSGRASCGTLLHGWRALLTGASDAVADSCGKGTR